VGNDVEVVAGQLLVNGSGESGQRGAGTILVESGLEVGSVLVGIGQSEVILGVELHSHGASGGNISAISVGTDGHVESIARVLGLETNWGDVGSSTSLREHRFVDAIIVMTNKK